MGWIVDIILEININIDEGCDGEAIICGQLVAVFMKTARH